MKKLLLLSATVYVLAGCWNTDSSINYSIEPKPETGRWYTAQMVDNGKATFAIRCAICHGRNAEATPNWKQTDANGNYPPPPLNGSAHAWHHDIDTLATVIKEGGRPLGGVMPAFGGQLSDKQVLEVIASFQSYWPDETYEKWLGMFYTSE